MSPTFLLALDGKTEYLIHTATPAFVAEVTEGPKGHTMLVPLWLHPVDDHEDDAIRQLMQDASAWYQDHRDEQISRN